MLGEGDALISEVPGVYVSIRTADCIPVLIVDLKRRAVAAVHAGWRGTVARIAPKAVGQLIRTGSRPEDLVAAIGPGVCGKCYTVGADVASQFKPFFPERPDLNRETQIDLPEANRRQLAELGISAVYNGAPCTLCNPEDFFSYRREGKRAGRMFSAAAVI
jgi:YfiH family protein